MQTPDRWEEGREKPSQKERVRGKKSGTQRGGQVEKIPNKRKSVNYRVIEKQWQHVRV